MERQGLYDIIEEDKSIAPVKAFNALTGELIATGNTDEEVKAARGILFQRGRVKGTRNGMTIPGPG